MASANSTRTVVGNSRDDERRRGMRLAAAVMFVRELERSIRFYRELLAVDVAVRDHTAALLVAPDGAQLYLRSMSSLDQQTLGSVGIQYLMWAAGGEDDLQRCERVLRERAQHTGTKTVDGYTMVEGRGPDGVPILVMYPGPDELPRHQILRRFYQWVPRRRP
jgi:catechol 2,3-dioxygenase-like lactoylglutathione lyase family enzyme